MCVKLSLWMCVCARGEATDQEIIQRRRTVFSNVTIMVKMERRRHLEVLLFK